MNKIHFLSLTVLLLFCSTLSAQNKKITFFDTFSDNQNLWSTSENNNYTLSIKGGKYIFKSLTDSSAFSSKKEILIDTKKDFVLNSSIQLKDGDGNYGLIWGADSTSEYDFLIDTQGRFAVTRWHNDSTTYLIDWSNQSSISLDRTKSNKLTIKKINSTLKFFINDTYAGRIPFEPFFGNQIGFIVNQKTSIEVNSVEVEEKELEFVVPAKNPQLSIDTLSFRESSKNGILDASEKGLISFTLSNNSDFDAYDIEILLSSQSPNNDLMYSNLQNIAFLKAHQRKKISFEIYAGTSLKASTQKFQLIISEINTRTPTVRNIEFKTSTSQEFSTSSDPQPSSSTAEDCETSSSCLLGILAFLTLILGTK